jgi:hypothetical protein
MNKKLITSLITAAAVAVGAAPAQGAVTIGSNLANAGPFTNQNCTTPCTTANLALSPSASAPGGVSSPVNGTITSYRVRSGSSGNISLRVLRPVSALTFTGAGSSPVAPIGTGPSDPIAANLPIRAGDFIGLNNPMDHLLIAAGVGAAQVHWNPPLSDGQILAGSSGGAWETMLQATVEPTNTLGFGKAAKNKKKGSAVLTVSVPNAGQLSIAGKGVKVAGGASRTVAAGELKLTIKAKGAQARKLRDKGKVKLNPTFTYTPNQGTQNQQSQKVKLAKN